VPEGRYDVLVSAITLLPGAELTESELDRVFDRLPLPHRPAYVHVVPSIPVTTWHRPVWSSLQRAGIPKSGRGKQVWRLDPGSGHYVEV
jgi:putative long chain acyl-CoA synthase